MSAPYDHLTRTPGGPWEGEDEPGRKVVATSPSEKEQVLESMKAIDTLPTFKRASDGHMRLNKTQKEVIRKTKEPMKSIVKDTFEKQLQNVAKEVSDRALAKAKSQIAEKLLLTGDLAGLTSEQRLLYYKMRTEQLGIDPFSKPFDYIVLGGKMVLYANKNLTEQLRAKNNISIEITESKVEAGNYVVVAKASTPDGRTDTSIAAVPIENLKGDARANAIMKAETKAKRRVTLSICSVGMLDETEVETITDAKNVSFDKPEKKEPEQTDAYDQGEEYELAHGEKPLYVHE